jgi:hypothetical protein
MIIGLRVRVAIIDSESDWQSRDSYDSMIRVPGPGRHWHWQLQVDSAQAERHGPRASGRAMRAGPIEILVGLGESRSPAHFSAVVRPGGGRIPAAAAAAPVPAAGLGPARMEVAGRSDSDSDGAAPRPAALRISQGPRPLRPLSNSESSTTVTHLEVQARPVSERNRFHRLGFGVRPGPGHLRVQSRTPSRSR